MGKIEISEVMDIPPWMFHRFVAKVRELGPNWRDGGELYLTVSNPKRGVVFECVLAGDAIDQLHDAVFGDQL